MSDHPANLSVIHRLLRRVKRAFTRGDAQNGLGNDGERMDIDFHDLNWDRMDIYQRSHFKRYAFAQTCLQPDDIVADMACGSGYGTMMLTERCREAHGFDIDPKTIRAVKARYVREPRAHFHHRDLLQVDLAGRFDQIVSFETVEHLPPENQPALFAMFHRALKPGGRLIFSTPYDQEESPASRRFHRMFHITEPTIAGLLGDRFTLERVRYQNYEHHDLADALALKHFIVCVARRNDRAIAT